MKSSTCLLRLDPRRLGLLVCCVVLKFNAYLAKRKRDIELHLEVTKLTDRYFRHSLRNIAIRDGKESGKDPKDSKDSLIQARVSSAFVELDQLATEKISLSNRLVESLARVNARLDYDLNKVIQLSGEQSQEQYEVRGGYVVGTLPGAPAPITLSANTSISAPAPRAVREVQDTIRASIGNELVAASPPISISAQGPPKRKSNRSLIILLVSYNWLNRSSS